MWQKKLVTATTGFALAWGGMVVAQQAGQQQQQAQRQQEQQQYQQGRQEREGAQAHPGARQGQIQLKKADKVIGTEVVNPQGENLGHIRELAIDGERGQVAYAVLEFDRLLTLRDKLFAVPWTALKTKDTERAAGGRDPALDRRTAGKTDETWFTEQERKGQYILDVPRERLEQAPGFDRDNWPDMANREWGTQVHSFYGQRPYWESERRGEMRPGQTGQPNQTGEQADRQTGQTGGQAGQAGAQQQHGQRMILKAEEQLIGQDVYNTQGEDIGELNNLLIDHHSGKVALAVVEFEKVEGDKNMATLPWNQVQWKWNEEEKEGSIVLKTSVDQVRQHLFAENNWPELDRQYVASIYREFNARPFWEADRATEDVLGFQE